jgi:uncharacterized protein with NRDE domain
VCLIIFAHRGRRDLPLVVAANRDEFYARPTAAAAPWPDTPKIIGGRDLRAGGSWLGITHSGRWAAVTNYREPPIARPEARSRGHLVADFLRGQLCPADYLTGLAPHAAEFNGFNLLVGDLDTVRWFSNRAGDHPLHDRDLEPGVYGLSNHLLDTPWPKVELGRADLERALDRGADPDTILEGLLDRTLAADADLPSTGLALAHERVLSSRFISGNDYGTRSSTVIRIGPRGRGLLLERSFLPPETVTISRHEFDLEI